MRQGDDVDAERWVLEKRANGMHRIRSVSCGKYLTVEAGSMAPGTRIRVWEANGTPSQKFFLEPWDYSYHKRLFMRSSIDRGMVLGVEDGSRHNGSCVQLGNCSNVDSRRWAIVPCSDYGSAYVVNLTSGRLLEAVGGGYG